MSVDRGLDGSSATHDEYWPSQTKKTSGFWERSNWFRTSSSQATPTNTVNSLQHELKQQGHKQHQQQHLQPQSAAHDDEAPERFPGNARSYSRFMSSSQIKQRPRAAQTPANAAQTTSAGHCSCAPLLLCPVHGKPDYRRLMRQPPPKVPRRYFSAVTGYSAESIRQVYEWVMLPILHPKLFRVLRVSPPAGVLLCGPSGIGKSFLVQRMVEHLPCYFHSVDAGQLVASVYRYQQQKAQENSQKKLMAEYQRSMEALKQRHAGILGDVKPSSGLPSVSDMKRRLQQRMADQRSPKKVQVRFAGSTDDGKDQDTQHPSSHGREDQGPQAMEQVGGGARGTPSFGSGAARSHTSRDDIPHRRRRAGPTALLGSHGGGGEGSHANGGGLPSQDADLDETLFREDLGAGGSPASFSIRTGSSRAHPSHPISKLFASLLKHAPSLLVIEGLDTLLAGGRNPGSDPLLSHVQATLMREMDLLRQRLASAKFARNVVVVGTVCKHHFGGKDPSAGASGSSRVALERLTRPGRFERQIVLRKPDAAARCQVLSHHLSQVPLAQDVSFPRLLDMTQGFSRCDLALLCSQAGLQAIAEGYPAFPEQDGQLQLDRVPGLTAPVASVPTSLTNPGQPAHRITVAQRHFLQAMQSPHLHFARTRGGGGTQALFPGLPEQPETQKPPSDRSHAGAGSVGSPPSHQRGQLSSGERKTRTRHTHASTVSSAESRLQTQGDGWESLNKALVFVGRHQLKQQLRDIVRLPVLHADIYARYNLSSRGGVLLYGPPGCGKSLCAQYLANNTRACVYVVRGSELLSRYVGESEKRVHELFAMARWNAPSVVFFDEMDALFRRRDGGSGSGSGGGKRAATNCDSATSRVVSALMTALDSLGQDGPGGSSAGVRRTRGAGSGRRRGVAEGGGVVVIGTTSRPDMIDPAVLRPGRLDQCLYVGLPGDEERVAMFRELIRCVPHRSDLWDPWTVPAPLDDAAQPAGSGQSGMPLGAEPSAAQWEATMAQQLDKRVVRWAPQQKAPRLANVFASASNKTPISSSSGDMHQSPSAGPGGQDAGPDAQATRRRRYPSTFHFLGAVTQGWSCADLRAAVETAKLTAIRATIANSTGRLQAAGGSSVVQAGGAESSPECKGDAPMSCSDQCVTAMEEEVSAAADSSSDHARPVLVSRLHLLDAVYNSRGSVSVQHIQRFVNFQKEQRMPPAVIKQGLRDYWKVVPSSQKQKIKESGRRDGEQRAS